MAPYYCEPMFFFLGNAKTDVGYHYPCCDIHGGGLCCCDELEEKKSMFRILNTKIRTCKIYGMSAFNIFEILIGDDKTAAKEMLLSIISIANEWIDNETIGKYYVMRKIRVPNDEEALEFFEEFKRRLNHVPPKK